MKIIKTFESITKTIDTFNENGTYKIFLFFYEWMKKTNGDIPMAMLEPAQHEDRPACDRSWLCQSKDLLCHTDTV